MKSLHITKAHGTGNDFLLVADVENSLSLDDATVASLCDRHRGVGADGLIRIAPGDSAEFFMDYRNADGSVAEMCGNGIRCMTKYLVDREMVGNVGSASGELAIETRSGVRHVTYWLGDDGRVETVEVDMGSAEFGRAAIPMTGAGDTGLHEAVTVESLGGRIELNGVSMGNPHAVVFVEDPATVDVAGIGRAIETAPIFTEGANVEFVKVVSEDHIKMRVWERGVGETLSCGTGACAAFAVARRLGAVGERAALDLPGGTLRLRWDAAIKMAGQAIEVFEAIVDLDSVMTSQTVARGTKED